MAGTTIVCLLRASVVLWEVSMSGLLTVVSLLQRKMANLNQQKTAAIMMKALFQNHLWIV